MKGFHSSRTKKYRKLSGNLTRRTSCQYVTSLMAYKYTTKATVIGPFPPEVSVDVVDFSGGSVGIKQSIEINAKDKNLLDYVESKNYHFEGQLINIKCSLPLCG